jgi:hypothetical protein
MIIPATIIETLYYILHKIGEADRVKLTKLIYLADKYHLIRYGRTITNDDYYAMKYGPAGTTLKDILSFDRYTHQYPEWNQYKDLFKESLTKRKRLEIYELLFIVKDDLLTKGIPEEHIRETEKILTGQFK